MEIIQNELIQTIKRGRHLKFIKFPNHFAMELF